MGVIRPEPFLHFESEVIYNPLTDRRLTGTDRGYEELLALRSGAGSLEGIAGELLAALKDEGWLVGDLGGDGARRFRLKYVSMEANVNCNQACYFCPVSTDPRADHNMTMEFYEAIVGQLARHKETIEAVSMVHYNEPTADRLFLDRLAVLGRYGLAAAVLTNGTGLTPRRVDTIIASGGLRFLSVNLSTLDRERYAQDRGGDHLDLVLRHLDYVKDLEIAEHMEIVVLGRGDAHHRDDTAAIALRFAGSRFEIKSYEVMDRAGNVPLGLKPATPFRRLCGCEQTGSRPLQWVHITPHGKCVLCCQDYHDKYVVGDLNEQTLEEILSGPEMARMRKWVYGLEEAPDDFICRSCIYARSE